LKLFREDVLMGEDPSSDNKMLYLFLKNEGKEYDRYSRIVAGIDGKK
jgi:hypothetical protein